MARQSRTPPRSGHPSPSLAAWDLCGVIVWGVKGGCPTPQPRSSGRTGPTPTDRVDTLPACSAARLSWPRARAPNTLAAALLASGTSAARQSVTNHPLPVVPKDESLKALEDDVVADDTERLIGLIAGPLAAVFGLVITSDLISHDPAQDWLSLGVVYGILRSVRARETQ